MKKAVVKVTFGGGFFVDNNNMLLFHGQIRGRGRGLQFDMKA